MANLEAFDEGHKGAGKAPISGQPAEGTIEQPAVTPQKAPAKDKFVPFAEYDSKPAETSTPENEPKVRMTGIRLPEDFGSRAAMIKAISNGAKVLGESHDLDGNPIVRRSAAPAASTSPALPKQPRKNPAVISYAEKLRNRIATGASPLKSQKDILKDADSHLTILQDHHNKMGLRITGDLSDRLVNQHQQIGQDLAEARKALNGAEVSRIRGGNPQVTNRIAKRATGLIHSSNVGLNNTDLLIRGGAGLSPVSQDATEENHAHADVEYPSESAPSEPIKKFRVGNTILDLTSSKVQEAVNRVSENPPAGVPTDRISDLKKAIFGKGTKKGTVWETGVTGSPMAPAQSPSPLAGGGAANGSPTSGRGPQSGVPRRPADVIVGKTVHMVGTHADAVPANAQVIDGIPHVNGQPIKRPAAPGVKFVEFGKHIGQKLVDKNGFEVPSTDEEGLTRTLRDLRRSGVIYKQDRDVSLAPSNPNAVDTTKTFQPPASPNSRSAAERTRRNVADAAALAAQIEQDKDTASEVMSKQREDAAANKPPARRGKRKNTQSDEDVIADVLKGYL